MSALHQTSEAFQQRESRRLHLRVLELARSALQEEAEPVDAKPPSAFQELALDIASFQRRLSAPLQRLQLKAASSLEEILPLPTSVYQRARVAVHPATRDSAVFRTSGTTSGLRGEHPFRTLSTYRWTSVAFAERTLCRDLPRATVVALAPPFRPSSESSLGFMMEAFMLRFDGRSLVDSRAMLRLPEEGRFLVGASGVDVAGLRSAIRRARDLDQPVLLLTTSFALVWLLDSLSEDLPLPPGSRVMHTGGFKGRSRSVPAADLRNEALRRFRLQESSLISEYGMTELSSQLYDEGQGPVGPGGGHVYRTPPWLRVDPVDAHTLRSVPDGEVGIARFIDLCNVDSAVAVLTQDRVRRVPGGLELLGRPPSSPARGCSLGIEELRASLRLPEPRVLFDLPARASEARPRGDGQSRLEESELHAAALQARQRVQALLAGAERLHQSERLVGALVESTGLSAGGVRWALRHSLERSVTPAELGSLLKKAIVVSEAIFVVPPANTFVAAARAVAWALASSSRVFVRLSRREPHMVRALHAQAPHLFSVVEDLSGVSSGDHVHVYGSGETLQSLEAQLPEGVQMCGYGPGFGLALVDLHGDLEQAARRLAIDVAAFDQQGCLSPRLCLTYGPIRRLCHFESALLAALAAWSREVPLGSAHCPAEAAWYRLTAACLGALKSSRGGAISRAVELPTDLSLLPLPPPGRNLEIVHVNHWQAQLQPLMPSLTCIGCNEPAIQFPLLRELGGACRRVALGTMQTPPLDGPADPRPPLRWVTGSAELG